MSGLFARLGRSSAVHIAFAFVAMGSWALFANRAYPLQRMLLAGLVQGALSGCLTLFLKRVVERLSAAFSGPPRLVAPPVIALLGSATLLVTFHMLSGTPEILQTIAVPLLVSTSYAALYNYSISKGRS